MSTNAINLTLTATTDTRVARGVELRSATGFAETLEQVVSAAGTTKQPATKETVDSKQAEESDVEAESTASKSTAVDAESDSGDQAAEATSAEEQEGSAVENRKTEEEDNSDADEVVVSAEAVQLSQAQPVLDGEVELEQVTAEAADGGQESEQSAEQTEQTSNLAVENETQFQDTLTATTAAGDAADSDDATQEQFQASSNEQPTLEVEVDEASDELVAQDQAEQQSAIAVSEDSATGTTAAIAVDSESNDDSDSTDAEAAPVVAATDANSSNTADSTANVEATTASEASTAVDTTKPADSRPAASNASSRTSETSEIEAVEVEESLDTDTAETDSADSTTTKAGTKPSTPTSTFQSFLERTTSGSRQVHSTPSQEIDTSGVDASRFVNRVSRAFQAADAQGGSIKLRLSPPELGAMKIEISVHQNTLTAKLETETAAAKNLLLDNLPALRERLAAQEIRIDKFEVDVQQQGSNSNPDWQAQQESQDRTNQSRSQRTATFSPTNLGQKEATDQPRRTASTHDGEFSAVA